MARAVAIGPHSRPSVSSSTARDAPSASMSRSWSAASAGPRVSTVTPPPYRSVSRTASSTAHSSCGLTVNPDMRVSSSWPFGEDHDFPADHGDPLDADQDLHAVSS